MLLGGNNNSPDTKLKDMGDYDLNREFKIFIMKKLERYKKSLKSNSANTGIKVN